MSLVSCCPTIRFRHVNTPSSCFADPKTMGPSSAEKFVGITTMITSPPGVMPITTGDEEVVVHLQWRLKVARSVMAAAVKIVVVAASTTVAAAAVDLIVDQEVVVVVSTTTEVAAALIDEEAAAPTTTTETGAPLTVGVVVARTIAEPAVVALIGAIEVVHTTTTTEEEILLTVGAVAAVAASTIAGPQMIALLLNPVSTPAGQGLVCN